MAPTAVGLSRDLPPKRVMRAFVDQQDLVVWRATNGDIAAWDNRCPHRGMALSHGFVRGNALACLYHGWHYGSSGTCTYIPAHPELSPPETIQARTFSAQESDGVIWVSTDGPAQADPLPFPTLPLRSFVTAASADDVHRACLATPFDGMQPEFLGNGAYQLHARRIVLLHNPLDVGRTQVTTLADADATPTECAALSRWCEAVRRLACAEEVAA